MSEEKTISMTEFREFATALRALASASDEAIDRMRKEGIETAETTNYATALRGFSYMLNFVNGIAGTVATAKYKDKIEPVVDKAKKDLKKQASEASGKARVGRPKKKP